MNPTAKSRLAFPSARLYQSLRTAHLERAHQLAPASILYRVTRYDFDEQAARGLDLIQASPLGIARLLLRSRVTRLEINEPLMLPSLPSTVAALAALRGRRILGGPKAVVVTYAIANTDPFDQNQTGGSSTPTRRTRLRRRVERRLARWAWSHVDRVVYGTDDARATYGAILGSARRAEETTIVALSSPHPTAGTHEVASGSVTFLGALMQRKGIRILLAAWPGVVAVRPDATLLVLGKGPLHDEVERAAEADPSIRVEIDPSRDRIHEALDSSRIVTLPSQPSPTWREQIGLPIVEGLSHGCTIVTTTQTSLAGWLEDHGHSISSDAESPGALTEALLTALAGGPARADVLASLPRRDARLLADDWLFERPAEALADGPRHGE